MTRPRYISSLFLLLFAIPLFSTPRTVEIKRKDGLQSNVVTSIIQDSKGIMWIGSWSGLCEYDGCSFRNVVPDNGEVYGTSPVMNIVEQPGTDYIWSSTSEGVCRVNSVSGETWTCLLRSSFDETAIFNEKVVSSPDGKVFALVLGQGVYSFADNPERMVEVAFRTFDSRSFIDIHCLGGDALLFVLSDGSSLRARYNTGENGEITLESEELFSLPGTITFSKENGGRLYLQNGGRLYELDLESGAVYGIYNIDIQGLYDVTRIDGERLLLLVNRETVYEYDTLSAGITLRSDLSQSNILFIFHADDDVLWVGVDNHGLIKYYDDLLPVKSYFDDPPVAVKSFVSDGSGSILLGTQGSGLILLKNGNKAGTFAMPEYPLLSNDISAISQNGNLVYIGGSGGVDVASFSHGNFKILRNLYRSDSHVYCSLYEPTDNALWLGTLTNGVVCLSLSDDAMSLNGEPCFYQSDRSSPNSLPRNFISSLAPDKVDPDYLWVATIGGYLCHMRKSDGYVDMIDRSDTYVKAILDMTYTSDSTLWLASNGLSYLDRENMAVRTVAKVPDFIIHSISCPDGRNIWMTTVKGVSRYDVAEDRYYDVADRESLDNDEFLNHASFVTEDGNIYFGASDGYDVIDCRSVSHTSGKMPIMIRDFLVRGELRNTALSDERIILPYSDNFFEITFASIDYIGVSKSEYKYRLKGFDKDWVSSGTSRKAVFTNVPAGKYEFEVRSGNEEDSMASLSIVIRRPWFRSILAIAIYVLLSSYLVVTIVLVTAHRRKRLAAELEEKAEEERRKKMFTSKLEFFTGVAKEFGSSITLIQGYAEQLSDKFHLPSKALEYLNTINSSAGKMQLLIEDVSEFRNVGAGQYVPTYAKVNAGSLLRMVLANLGEDRNFSVTIAKQLSEHRVISDSNALEKIFSGTISTALAYARTGSAIGISLDNIAGYGLAFSVSGESETIRTDDDIAKLVNRYSALEVSTSGQNENTDEIGLALVGNYVSSLDGELSCTRTGEALVTVNVKIPYAAESSPTELENGLEENADRQNDFNLAIPMVLVIDPEQDIRTLISDILSDEFRVMSAYDTMSASETINNSRPDIIVADVMQHAGYDITALLEQLRSNEITRHIPFVALSYATGNTSYIKELPYSFDAIIGKPFHPNELKTTIRRILRSRSDLRDYYNSALSDMDLIAGTAVTSSDKDFLISVVKIIQDNISDTELSPSFIADKMCMSPISLYRKIKAVFSTTPVDLIRSIRLRNAERLLKTTSISIADIMYRSGFNNHSYFNRKFIEAYGMSPKKYRNSQK